MPSCTCGSPEAGSTSASESRHRTGGPTMMRACAFILLLGCLPALAGPPETLPGTRPLTEQGDLSKAMLDGIHRFAERKIDESVARRAKFWSRDPSSREAYERSVRANRESFRRIIGVV